MGLKLRYNLFRDVGVKDIYASFVSFYEKRGRPLEASGDDFHTIRFHEADNGWVVVKLDGGWEMNERRAAYLHTSKILNCPGFLIFVYDGDYWGYEFFANGQILDQFVQENDSDIVQFVSPTKTGDPSLLSTYLPFLNKDDIAAYLVQKMEKYWREDNNVKARSGDEFHRFDECAVIDFLRMLGVRVNLVDEYVRLDAPIYRTLYKNHD